MKSVPRTHVRVAINIAAVFFFIFSVFSFFTATAEACDSYARGCGSPKPRPPAPPRLIVSCSADNFGSISEDEQVRWTSAVSGGTGSYTYSWSGTDGLDGSSSTATHTYSTSGNKTARVTVTSRDGQSKTANCSTFVDPKPLRFLDISCDSSSSRVDIGDSVRRIVDINGGHAPFDIEWEGTDGLDGHGTSVTKRYTSSGTKRASVTVTDDQGQVETDTCDSVVVEEEEEDREPRFDTLRVSCPSIDRTYEIDERVTRRVEISGGNSPYDIEWSGTDGLDGTGRSVSITYDREGTKRAEVTVSDDDGREITRTCNSIEIESDSNGSPNVSLFQTVAPAELASAPIYLEQIPYTGIEDYPMPLLYLGGVTLISLLISGFLYIQSRRKRNVQAF